MPMPTDIDPDKLAEWKASADACVADPPPDMGMLRHMSVDSLEKFKEMHIAGDWLGDELDQLECPEEKRKKICFAYGQKCFGQPDVWQVAQAQLDWYRAGHSDEPGKKLAEEIWNNVKSKLIVDDVSERRKALFDKYTKFV